jgi:hypothetical protein
MKYAWITLLLLLPFSALAFDVVSGPLPLRKIEIEMNKIASERETQDTLPVAKDKLWDMLMENKTSFSEKTHKFSIALTDKTKAMAGKKIAIDGFMYPLEFTDEQKIILLSRRTPVCFFCPPGEPTEVIFVELAEPVELNSDLLRFEGIFELTDRAEEGIFFILKDAKIK